MNLANLLKPENIYKSDFFRDCSALKIEIWSVFSTVKWFKKAPEDSEKLGFLKKGVSVTNSTDQETLDCIVSMEVMDSTDQWHSS